MTTVVVRFMKLLYIFNIQFNCIIKVDYSSRSITIEKQTSIKQNIIKYLLTISVVAYIFSPVVIWASGSMSVTPSTNLSNGQVVTVSGSGFTANSTGSILECNSDPSQPTITFFGNPIPVSCSKPFSALVNTDSSGNIPSTAFTIVTGTVGPPNTGTDSTGGDAAVDAAKYPCPPTPAQVAAGYICNLSFGDVSNDNAVQNLTFLTTSTPAQSSGSTPVSGTGSSSSSKKTTTTTTTTPAITAAIPSSTNPLVDSSTVKSTATLTVAVDTKQAQSIPGAKVTLDNKMSVTTDKDGLATFQNVLIGKHTIIVVGPNNKITSTQVTLTSAQNKLLSIELAS